jgi:hypothetical protein
MSVLGQSRHFDRGPAPSGLPRSTDIVRPPRHVGLVPTPDLSPRALLQRVSITLPLRFRTAATTNHQCKFYSIPCTKKGTVGCKICGSSPFMSRVTSGHNCPPHLERFAINPNPIYGRRGWKKVLPPRSKPALS